jgi:subtilisin-like proprotein convertase family protein
MTSPSRRWIAPTLILTLAVGGVAALAAPASAAQSTFTQSTDLLIGDDDYDPVQATDIVVPASGTVGVAAPYGSEIVVPPSAQAPIVDVTVDIDDLTHHDPLDLDILLVGPGGQQVLLMSDAADATDVTNVDLNFDDAAGAIPSTALMSGTYKPTNVGAVDAFPAPAPASTGNTSLSVFDGTNPTGTWRLFVLDDQSSGVGTIGSWGLHLTLDTTPYPSTLAVSGLPPVSDVNVRLQGITSSYLDDIDLLLVGPSGQQATILSDAGGFDPISGVNLLLDDEATDSVPDSTPAVSGTFKPTNTNDGSDSYPVPAPDTNDSSSLSVFDGVSPNGPWSLYAVDDASDDATVIGEWSLEFTWADTAGPSGSVTVNGGAATTSSASVTLNLSATDPAPASGLTGMRFSNDGVTFSAYQPYAATAAWTLTAGDGVKTVYAQFKDADGNQSAVVTDAITLALPDTTSPTVTKTTPKKNATDVKATTKVKVKASEALKGSTVTKKTVFLKAKGSSDKVKAKVSYNSSKKMIVLTPSKALKKDKKYNVTVTTKVKDVAGNAFDAKPGKPGAQALKFSFTTA